MRVNIIGYTFLGIWKKQPAQIPVLDKKFILDLLDNDPYTTNSLIHPDGLLITKPQIIGVVTPSVIIGPAKVQAAHSDLEKLEVIIHRLREELEKNMKLEFGQFALNVEYEFLDLKTENTQWLYDTYLKPLDGVSKAIFRDVSLELRTNDGDVYNVQIQPRIAKVNGLYVVLNENINQELMLDSKLNIKKLFELSLQKNEKSIFKILKL